MNIFKKLVAGFVLLAVAATCSASSWSGSGFFVNSEGYIVTAGHVVDSPYPIYMRILYKGKFYEAHTVAYDAYHDWAIIKVNLPVRDFFYIDTDQKIGTQVAIQGWPLGIAYTTTTGVIQNGYISSVDGVHYTPHWQFAIDGRACPGNSGGPVMNRQDYAIGILVSGLTSARWNPCSSNVFATEIKEIFRAAELHGVTLHMATWFDKQIKPLYSSKELHDKNKDAVVFIIVTEKIPTPEAA